MVPFLLWFVIVELLGLAALPLAMATLPRLADRGYGLAKVLGLLLVTYLNYLLGSIVGLGNNTPLLALGMVVLFALGLFALRAERSTLRAWFREQYTLVLVQEGLFLALFVVWALVRAYHPAVMSTEKPMDLALMTAAHKATSFPPYDPWMAGTTINYYYGGYLAIGTLVTLSGVAPAVGYNLGLALLFALVGGAAYSVAYNLIRHRAWAALGTVFVLLVGNLDALWQVLSHGTTGFNFFQSSRVVESTQCINHTSPCTITEFPAFSFLLGDLHPHVIALPFTILVIGLALNLALAAKAGWDGLAPDTLRRALTVALAAVAVGALYFMNSWDWPSYLLLLGAALLVPGLPSLARRPLLEAVGLAAGMLALSYLFYVSFHLDFKPQYSSFGIRLHGSPTGDVLTMFGLFLLPVAVFIIGLLGQAARVALQATAPVPQVAATVAAASGTASVPARGASRERRGRTAVLEREPDSPGGKDGEDEDGDDELPRLPLPPLPRLDSPVGAGIALVAAAVVLWAVLGTRGLQTVGLLLPFLCAGLYLAWHEARAERRANAFALLLCAGGIGLIILCDFLFLKDNFCSPDASGNCTYDLYRMNTVFKFYYQAWTVLALGAAYGLYVLSTRLRAGWQRFVAPGGAVVLAAAGGIYLLLGLFANPSYLDLYTNPVPSTDPTLNAAAYLSGYSGQPITITNAIPDDAVAITWLNSTIGVHDHPTILEADEDPGSKSSPRDYWPFPGDPYQEILTSRISTFTGLPTVLGSGGSHEGLWHSQALVDTRFADVTTMYTSTDLATVGRLLRQYNVRYIYVGGDESYLYYNANPALLDAALARFKHFGTVVYNQKGVTILRTSF